MLTKVRILESMKRLPDNNRLSADKIIDRIILLYKIETGLEQVSKRQVVTDEELNNRLSKWLE